MRDIDMCVRKHKRRICYIKIVLIQGKIRKMKEIKNIRVASEKAFKTAQ